MKQFATRVDRQKLWVAILSGVLVGFLTRWEIGVAVMAGSLVVMALFFGRLLKDSEKPDWASERAPS